MQKFMKWRSCLDANLLGGVLGSLSRSSTVLITFRVQPELSTCLSVCISWTGLSSVRLALGLPQDKLGVTLAYVVDMSHSKLAPPKHEHASRLTRRHARRRSHTYVVARSDGRAHT